MTEKKIIFTESELKILLFDTYQDGFYYGKVFDEEHKNKKVWSSKGRDALTYVRKIVGKLLK